ncbi:MAG: hypothetical protein AAFZ38_04820 [Myxococcota bacterium]
MPTLSDRVVQDPFGASGQQGFFEFVIGHRAALERGKNVALEV